MGLSFVLLRSYELCSFSSLASADVGRVMEQKFSCCSWFQLLQSQKGVRVAHRSGSDSFGSNTNMGLRMVLVAAAVAAFGAGGGEETRVALFHGFMAHFFG